MVLFIPQKAKELIKKAIEKQNNLISQIKNEVKEFEIKTNANATEENELIKKEIHENLQRISAIDNLTLKVKNSIFASPKEFKEIINSLKRLLVEPLNNENKSYSLSKFYELELSLNTPGKHEKNSESEVIKSIIKDTMTKTKDTSSTCKTNHSNGCDWLNNVNVKSFCSDEIS